MRTEQLHYLLDIAKTNSINKSSERLHITHQSLNTAIKNLEKELDIEIFTRNTQGVFLTEAGKEAVKIGEEILEKYEQLKGLTNNSTAHSMLKGELAVLAAPFMGLSLASDVTNDYITNYPKVNLKTKSKETVDILKLLNQHQADLYFIVSFFPDEILTQINQKQFICQKILEDKLCLVASTGHELSRFKTVSLSTVLKYPLALFQASDDSPNPIMDIMPKNSKPKINLITDHIETYCQMIQNGKLVALVPEHSFVTSAFFRDNPLISSIAVKNIPTVGMWALIDVASYQQKKLLIDAYLDIVKQYV